MVSHNHCRVFHYTINTVYASTRNNNRTPGCEKFEGSLWIVLHFVRTIGIQTIHATSSCCCRCHQIAPHPIWKADLDDEDDHRSHHHDRVWRNPCDLDCPHCRCRFDWRLHHVVVVFCLDAQSHLCSSHRRHQNHEDTDALLDPIVCPHARAGVRDHYHLCPFYHGRRVCHCWSPTAAAGSGCKCGW